LLPDWAQVSDEELDFASLLGETLGEDTFVEDLNSVLGIGATYDESALPEEDVINPEDDLGNQAI
jgi:hypothetical protein